MTFNAPAIPEVWLCDLTYTQMSVAADAMPAAIGCIAEYAKKTLGGDRFTFRLFKYPEKLAEALEAGGRPAVMGFSNYVWNRDLAAAMAQTARRHLPGVVIVFGGPDYPLDEESRRAFLAGHPMMDFFVVGEGEWPFAQLLNALADAGFDPGRVPAGLPSIHRRLPDGGFDMPPLALKLGDMNDIPSPYLSGAMDEFFDGRLIPILQTIRGCPFSCTFCTEGQSYHSKVAKSDHAKIHAEIMMIAERMASLRDQGLGRTDMHIADSNFGMYKEDIPVCESLAEAFDRFGYPEHINVATGKNQKRRVLEAARIVGGRLKISGAVQSLDQGVLANVKRSNISAGEIIDLAHDARDIGADSDSAVISCLPGDSRDAHFGTIRQLIEAGFNNVAMYQLMLLPGTEMATPESRAKWKMRTRYRVLPRCFGTYRLFGEEVRAAEIEEICVATETFTPDDYREARRFHLLVNIFYNDAIFREALDLLERMDIPRYEWLKLIHDEASRGGEFGAFLGEFLREAEAELWPDRAPLESFVREDGTINRYLAGELGANLIFKYKAVAVTERLDLVAGVAKDTLAEVLRAHGRADAVELAQELIEFGRLRMSGVFTMPEETLSAGFRYDVVRFAADGGSQTEPYRFPVPRPMRFQLAPDQVRTVRNFLGVYGANTNGYGRIIARFSLPKLLRHAS